MSYDFSIPIQVRYRSARRKDIMIRLKRKPYSLSVVVQIEM